MASGTEFADLFDPADFKEPAEPIIRKPLITNHKMVEVDPVIRYRLRIKEPIKTAIKEVHQVVRTGIGAGLVVTLYIKTDVMDIDEVKKSLKVVLQKYNLDIDVADFKFEKVVSCTKTVLQ
jgi:hypothetical protein